MLSFTSNNQTTLNSDPQTLDLLDKCKRGDRTAQYMLYQQYSRAMYNVCRRMMRDDMEAEDMLQNSFVVVFTKLHSFRGESTIGAWIKRIVVNNCINELKKRKLLTNEWDDSYMEYSEDTQEEYHDDDVKRIKKALHQLPPGYKQVFTLYALEGYDHQEIGSILGVSETTSKSQYSRAKQKIRQLLEKQ